MKSITIFVAILALVLFSGVTSADTTFDGLWSMQRDGTFAQFKQGASGFDPSKPTIVLVHGWVPDNRYLQSPTEWSVADSTPATVIPAQPKTSASPGPPEEKPYWESIELREGEYFKYDASGRPTHVCKPPLYDKKDYPMTYGMTPFYLPQCSPIYRWDSAGYDNSNGTAPASRSSDSISNNNLPLKKKTTAITVNDPYLPSWIRETVNEVTQKDCIVGQTCEGNYPAGINGHTLKKPDTGKAHLLGRRNDINILAWNWTDIASTSYGGIPKETDPATHLPWPGKEVFNQGQELALSLEEVFGDNYKQAVQLIGHSLGGGVAAYAAYRLAGQRGGKKYDIDQITIFDMPEIYGVKIGLPVFILPEDPASYMVVVLKNIVQKFGVWVDNYPTVFGTEYNFPENSPTGDIVNFEILGHQKDTNSQVKDIKIDDKNVVENHSYPCGWYFGVEREVGTLDSQGIPDKRIGAFLSKVLNRESSPADIEKARQEFNQSNVWEVPDPESRPYTLKPVETVSIFP